MTNRNQKRMFRGERRALKPIALAALLALAGCGARSSPLIAPGELLHYQNVALEIETPNLKPAPDDPALATISPETISASGPVQYWDMKLSDAMHIALVALESDARSGRRRAALAAIGAHDFRSGPCRQRSAVRRGGGVRGLRRRVQRQRRFATQPSRLNNIFFGGGTRILIQDLDTFKEEIVKETPTGTQFTFRHNTTYDNNNEPGNLFPSAWDTNFEAEVRQHLLQGGGLEYNRIAGPHGSPGQLNGVLIARINTDVALNDFEMGIRDLASNVENAYWDLYFAYRDLDAKVLARDNALESWRRMHALFLAGRRGGEAEKEAQVRQQYFQFQEEVENAWNGRLLDATHTDDGSAGGTFRGIGGVRSRRTALAPFAWPADHRLPLDPSGRRTGACQNGVLLGRDFARGAHAPRRTAAANAGWSSGANWNSSPAAISCCPPWMRRALSLPRFRPRPDRHGSEPGRIRQRLRRSWHRHVSGMGAGRAFLDAARRSARGMPRCGMPS